MPGSAYALLRFVSASSRAREEPCLSGSRHRRTRSRKERRGVDEQDRTITPISAKRTRAPNGSPMTRPTTVTSSKARRELATFRLSKNAILWRSR